MKGTHKKQLEQAVEDRQRYFNVRQEIYGAISRAEGSYGLPSSKSGVVQFAKGRSIIGILRTAFKMAEKEEARFDKRVNSLRQRSGPKMREEKIL